MADPTTVIIGRFAAAAEALFASDVAATLAGATVYMDAAFADCWSLALSRGGLARFVTDAGAVRIVTLGGPTDGASSTAVKVFFVTLHASTAMDAITAIVRASPTTRVTVYSATPFRLSPGTEGESAEARTRLYGETPRDRILAQLRRAVAESSGGNGSNSISRATAGGPTDTVACEYLPLSHAPVLDNVLVVPSSPTTPSLLVPWELDISPAGLWSAVNGSGQQQPQRSASPGWSDWDDGETDDSASMVSSVSGNNDRRSSTTARGDGARERQLAIALFAAIEAHDTVSHTWARGPAAEAVVRNLHAIRRALGLSDAPPGASRTAVVVVDRSLDLLGATAPTDHILSRIYRASLSSPPATLATAATVGPAASIAHLTHIEPERDPLPVISKPLPPTVPFLPFPGSVASQWMHMLADFPVEGVSLLRKKIMDLGAGKARVLGRPTAAQYAKLLSIIHESPNRHAIVRENAEALLLAGLVMESLDESQLKLFDRQQWWLDVTIHPPADFMTVVNAIYTGPMIPNSVTVRTALAIIGTALQTPTPLEAAAAIVPSVAPALSDAVNQLSPSPTLRESLNGDQVSSTLMAWLASGAIPEQVPDLVRQSTLIAVNSVQVDQVFVRIKEKKEDLAYQALGGLLGGIGYVYRFLFEMEISHCKQKTNRLGRGGREPQVPIDCDDIMVAVTGPVSWPEISAFRAVAKEVMARTGKPMTLICTGIEGPISLKLQ
ncbi:hypothetical protein BC828DRAFT_380679 [Blastocladiella britannica]|nr:hypothetical protein BC828DRAFT_380679 [Blastocladiella britannica]